MPRIISRPTVGGIQLLVMVFALLFLESCGSLGDSLLTSQATVKRSDTVRIAELYLNHRWTPSQANVYHGVDGEGIPVNTPDEFYLGVGEDSGWWRTGVENVGVPYQWGGFDTPKEFDQNIKAGYFAGDVFSADKRRLLGDAVSEKCTGVDCSGFVSRCWRLSRHVSTRELPSISQQLSSYEELKTGDILNKANDHVVLFSHFEDGKVIVYEAAAIGINRVSQGKYLKDYFRRNGYVPYRYNGIVD